MFSDELIGLDIAHCRELRARSDHAQSIINGMANDETRLRRRIRELEAELVRERGLRLVAQARIEELLDMEI